MIIFLCVCMASCGHQQDSTGAIALPPYTIYHSFDEYYAQKSHESASLEIREECSQKIVRHTEGQAQISILYIHDLGRCRTDGEQVLNQIGTALQANIYYLRLPGHGRDRAALLDSTFREQLAAVRDAVLMMHLLGERIFVVGNGYGGLLATYVSALFPHRISGTILVSPMYEFADPLRGLLLENRRLRSYVEAHYPADTGEEAVESWSMWQRYWYTQFYAVSFSQVIEAQKRIVKPRVINNVDVPVYLLYYYRNRNNQDTSASVTAMRKVFDHFTHPANRELQIAQGDHALLSHRNGADTGKIINGIVQFIWTVVTETPAPKPDSRGYF